MNVFVVFLVIISTCYVEAQRNEEKELTEARGKGKYALLISFLYVVATKIVVLKIVYGIIFYVLITKGWHFVLWFIHYLKEKKHDHHHEYIEHDHEPVYLEHGHHDHGHYHHDHYGHDYDPYYGQYEKPGYGKSDYYRKRIYDSDGSYAVKGA